jgi:hypothetical protein
MDQLRAYLEAILASRDLEAKVYIQPPAGMQMDYPCIAISRGTGETAFADNEVHRHQKRYELTAIDEDPESPLYDLLASLPRSRHDRSFPADNLNHDVFTLFF